MCRHTFNSEFNTESDNCDEVMNVKPSGCKKTPEAEEIAKHEKHIESQR